MFTTMFTVKTSIPEAAATSAAAINCLNRGYWPLVASIAPWVLRSGYLITDGFVFLVFGGACPSTICHLMLLGLPVHHAHLHHAHLGPLTPFAITAPQWTRDELICALTQRQLVHVVSLEAVGPGRWRIWASGATLRDVRNHLKSAHARFYGNHPLSIVKSTGAATPPSFANNLLDVGAVIQFAKAELEADDQQRLRAQLPVDSRAELQAELEQARWDLEIAELRLEECEANHQ